MDSGVAWTVATAMWAILPAYVPNSAAAVFGGGAPIDGGRTWRGRRLLGDGKTRRGFVAGTLAGVATAVALNVVGLALSVDVPAFPPGAVVGLPAGAMLGDLVGSLLKRRTGRERGAPFPLVDQLSFLVGALSLSLVAAPTWTATTFTPAVLLVLVVLTPLAHRFTNRAAYHLGVKSEPW